MISTSSHNNLQSNNYTAYNISGDRGKSVGYKGKSYPKLAPKKKFWDIWHSNIGIIPEEENNKYYIREYYDQVLSHLDPEEVYKDLDNSVLLCYEDNMEFCHRHIVAAWFELLLDVEVPEEKIVDDKIEIVERPAYIKEYLEEYLRKDRNMRGFNSLRALYLFEKSEELLMKADEIEKDTRYEREISVRQRACFLRCDADEAEYQYNQKMKVKVLTQKSDKNQ